jgi:hypothetical protein
MSCSGMASSRSNNDRSVGSAASIPKPQRGVFLGIEIDAQATSAGRREVRGERDGGAVLCDAALVGANELVHSPAPILTILVSLRG